MCGGARELVLEALGARGGFAFGDARVVLARHAACELGARVTERREIVGELAKSARLFEREIRRAVVGGKKEDVLRRRRRARSSVALEKLRVAHPSRERAQIRAANLDGGERFGANRGFGLGASR